MADWTIRYEQGEPVAVDCDGDGGGPPQLFELDEVLAIIRQARNDRDAEWKDRIELEVKPLLEKIAELAADQDKTIKARDAQWLAAIEEERAKCGETSRSAAVLDRLAARFKEGKP